MVSVLVVGTCIEHERTRDMLRRTRVTHLKHHTLMYELLRDVPRHVHNIDAKADAFAQTLSMRVLVVGHGQKLLGDSVRTVAQIAQVDVLDTASFVQSPGPDRFAHMTFMTHKGSGSDALMIITVASPDRLAKLVHSIRVLMLASILFGVCAALIMSNLAALFISTTLRNLIDRARSLARSHSSERSPWDHGALRDVSYKNVDFATSLQDLARTLEGAVDDLARERDRFETILESMTEAVIALNAQHEVTMLNHAAYAFFAPQIRMLNGQVRGERVTDFLRVPVIVELLEQVREGKSTSTEMTIPGHPERHVIVHMTPRSASSGSVLVMHDVTELRRLETVRRDFVANVSHELRTPVSVLLATSETLLEDDLQDVKHVRSFLHAIFRNADRLSRLIADLLDISRLEAGKFKLELEPVSLFGVVLLAIDGLDAKARKKNQQIDVDVDMECMVYVDAKALDQIMYNLIDNAIKYTPEGKKILITASAIEDPMQAMSDRATWRVEVVDDGPGLAPEHRARIFERFYRIDEGRSRDVGGTGLGLSIVKHLATAMGGRVGVRPNTPNGSVFWVNLPQALLTDEVAEELAPSVELLLDYSGAEAEVEVEDDSTM